MPTHMRLVAQGHNPDGDIWVTGFHVMADDGQTVSDVNSAWQTAWALAWNGTGASDDIKSLIKTTVGTDQLTTTEILANGKNGQQATATSALVGTATDDCMPPETCPCISLRTTNASKAGRGRGYWPVLTEASNAGNGEMVTASQNQIALAAQAVVQSLNGASMQVVVWHKDSLTFDQVVAVDVANLFRSQRRRQNRIAVTRVRHTV